MIDDACDLYLKYEGRQHARIEREMRDRGWRFGRQLLYLKRHLYGVTEGWPERFGWWEMLTPAQQFRARSRNALRHGYEAWLTREFPEWTWTWDYQRYIYLRLAALTAGTGRRLMIFMPPRHGKTELVTVRYTAWRLLRDPALNVILGSYNQQLANRFSRKIRRIAGKAGYAGTAGALAFTAATAENALFAGNAGALACTAATAAGQRPDIQAHHAGRTGVADKSVRTPIRAPLNTSAEWETPHGGGVRAVGVGAGIAGFGAGLIVIDDPIRNRADAESQTHRDRVWDWFNDDIYTRMEPNASIILIQTRWHEDDLAGRLLKESADGGEPWDVVSLPALAEEAFQDKAGRSAGNAGALACTDAAAAFGNAPDINTSEDTETSPAGGTGGTGEGACAPGDRFSNSKFEIRNSKFSSDPLGRPPGAALCPARFNEAALHRLHKKLGSYSFSALYQQNPAPADGGQFKRSWFGNIIDRAPEGLRWKRGWDLAVSIKTSADYTASFRCARDRTGNLYIADGIRRRIEYPDQRRLIIERMRAEPNTEHGIEAAIHGGAVVQDLRRDWRLGRFAFREVRVRGDKLTRALAWLNLAEEGRLYLVRGPWIDDFIDEIARFPTARHDDQIDAVSIAVSMLTTSDKRLYVF